MKKKREDWVLDCRYGSECGVSGLRVRVASALECIPHIPVNICFGGQRSFKRRRTTTNVYPRKGQAHREKEGERKR